MHKRVIALVLIGLIAVGMAGCANSKVIDGREYQPYGLLNDDVRDPAIEYRISTGNFVLSFIFAETLIVPAVLISTQIMEPVEKKRVTHSTKD